MPPDFGRNRFSGETAHLQSALSDAWNRSARVGGTGGRQISGHEHLGMAWHGQIGTDNYPSGAVDGNPQRASQ